jgi:hypothetical protein
MWNEELAAVGVWSSIYPTNSYEIYIYTNVKKGASKPTEGGSLAYFQKGTLDHAGFTTIHLKAPVALADRTTFAVIYRQTGTGRSTHVNCSYPKYYPKYCAPVHESGNSYFGDCNGESGVDGASWYDGATIHEKDPGRADPDFGSWAATIKAYTRSTVRARAADSPCEADDGNRYLSYLIRTNWDFYIGTARTFGASAGLVGANGRSLWSSWLAGFEPSDPADSELRVSIAVTNGVPYLSWSPDLKNERKYTVYGRQSLDAGYVWTEVDNGKPSKENNRFFKVSVENK